MTTTFESEKKEEEIMKDYYDYETEKEVINRMKEFETNPKFKRFKKRAKNVASLMIATEKEFDPVFMQLVNVGNSLGIKDGEAVDYMLELLTKGGIEDPGNYLGYLMRSTGKFSLY